MIAVIRAFWHRLWGRVPCTGCGRAEPVRFCGIDREGRGMRLCVGCRTIRMMVNDIRGRRAL